MNRTSVTLGQKRRGRSPRTKVSSRRQTLSEYWIVDPDAEMIEQYTLEGETYQLHVKTNTGTVRSVAVEGFSVPVRAVLDEGEKLSAVREILSA
jgi:Uma2 family endonuclease